jgi:TRAP-type C4-dicarboxylate transport system permease small subunit
MMQFFPMGKGEALMLVYLLVMAVISFLPMWRTMEIGGVAVFGWLMAALMITSPLLALLVFRRSDKARVGKSSHDTTGIEDTESESRSLNSEAEPEA